MKPISSNRFRSLATISSAFSVAFFIHFTAPFALAATLYWDGGSVDILTNGNGASAGGSGTWNTTILNWDAGASPHVAWTNGTDTAEINGGTQGITLGTNITVGRINQKAGGSGASIAEGAGPYTITLGSATTIFNVAASVTAGRTLNVNAVVTGSNNLSIQGPTTTAGGVVNLNRINTFTGTLAIDDTTLRIGNGGTAGQLNSGSYTGAISITSTGTFTYASSLDQTLGGVISGSGTLTKNSADSTLTLTNASTYSGNTTVAQGTLKAGADNVLPSGAGKSNIAVNAGASSAGTLDLNGFNLSINGLAGTAAAVLGSVVNNATATDKTLTIGNGNATATFAGIIADNTSGTGTIALIKVGTGTQTLSGPNTYTGTTTISAGKLLGGVGGNCANSEVIIGDASATGGVSITDNTLSWTCKALTASAAGGLEFDFGIVTPSISVSPLTITNLANFTTATPTVSVVVSTGLAPGTYPLMTWGSISGTAPTTAGLSVSTLAAETTASLGVSGNTLNLIITSTPAIVKDDNTNNLNLGASWVGNLAPSSSNLAKWNSTVTTANTTDLGADITWAGIAIENPNGLVTINGSNTLTLGNAAIDIDLSSANTADLILNCPLALGADNIWDVAATRTVTLGGQISGAFPITKQNDGTAILSSAANNYSSATTVAAGTLQLGASNVIPDGSGNGNISVAGTLDLNGKSETINGLSGAGIIDNTLAATSPTLTVGANDQTSTFSGAIQSTAGTVNLNKTGTGTLTLSGANTFTGTVAIAASTGTLVVGNVTPLDNVTGITMGGGTTLRSSVNDAKINAPITLGGVGTTATIHASTFDGPGTTLIPFRLNGAIVGDGDLILNGVEATNSYGLIILNAASSYTGDTRMDTESGFAGGAPFNANIFVRLGTENALPTTTVLTLDGGAGAGSGGRACELNLNGNNQTLAGLASEMSVTARNQTVTNTGAPATLTVNNSVDCSFGRSSIHEFNSVNFTTRARIQDDISLVKSGVGRFTLLESHTYTGTTTITGGTLALGSSNVLPATPVSIAGGTLAIGATFTDTAGTLDITGAATINVAAGAQLVFADSSGVNTGTWAGNLSIGGFVSGTTLNFGSITGLTAQQLSKISATGFTNFGLDAEGDLTATSTGGFSSWIASTFANGTIPLDKRGANDDYDNDGISNLVEYGVAGEDPTVSKAAIGSFTGTLLSFSKRLDASGLTYAIQESTDLGAADDWTEVTGGSYVNDATTISYTLTPGTPVKNFIRLQVLSN